MKLRIRLKKMDKKMFWGLFILFSILFLSGTAQSQSLPKTPSALNYKYLFHFPTQKGDNEKAYGKPRTLAINSKGLIFVVVPYAKEVRVYSDRGIYLFSFGTKIKEGNETGKFSEPSGITIDDRDQIYVSDLERDKILIFNPEGEFMNEFPIFQPRGKLDACAPFIRYNPYNKLIYIPDPCNHRVNIHTVSGDFITSFGEMGSNLGEFGGPANCIFNKKEEIFIVDPGNFRIQSFNANHKPINFFGTKGTNEGEFVRPYDIGIDSADRLYVSDFVLKSIQVFDHKGKFLGTIKEKGFDQPLGIACSPEDLLYIVDGEGQKIHVIQMD